MPSISSADLEREGVLKVAELMAISARTAPKAKGVDAIETLVVYGEELEKIASEMDKLAQATGLTVFKRDADCVRRSLAMVLIGVKGSEPRGINCGACGYSSCEEFSMAKKVEGKDFKGPNCMYAVVDLGIAIGSAVKTASEMNVDNRIMRTAGTAARKLGLLNADIVFGIPLSATGKNIYFDRKTQ